MKCGVPRFGKPICVFAMVHLRGSDGSYCRLWNGTSKTILFACRCEPERPLYRSTGVVSVTSDDSEGGQEEDEEKDEEEDEEEGEEEEEENERLKGKERSKARDAGNTGSSPFTSRSARQTCPLTRDSKKGSNSDEFFAAKYTGHRNILTVKQVGIVSGRSLRGRGFEVGYEEVPAADPEMIFSPLLLFSGFWFMYRDLCRHFSRNEELVVTCYLPRGVSCYLSSLAKISC